MSVRRDRGAHRRRQRTNDAGRDHVELAAADVSLHAVFFGGADFAASLPPDTAGGATSPLGARSEVAGARWARSSG